MTKAELDLELKAIELKYELRVADAKVSTRVRRTSVYASPYVRIVGGFICLPLTIGMVAMLEASRSPFLYAMSGEGRDLRLTPGRCIELLWITSPYYRKKQIPGTWASWYSNLVARVREKDIVNQFARRALEDDDFTFDVREDLAEYVNSHFIDSIPSTNFATREPTKSNTAGLVRTIAGGTGWSRDSILALNYSEAMQYAIDIHECDSPQSCSFNPETDKLVCEKLEEMNALLAQWEEIMGKMQHIVPSVPALNLGIPTPPQA